MSINIRNKGAVGERELCALLSDELGFIVKRRLDAPREGGADSLDVPGWSIECKRYAKATRADIDTWWAQAVTQGQENRRKPVLAYRLDRAGWRVVVLASDAFGWGKPHTVEMSLQFWCEIVREELAA